MFSCIDAIPPPQDHRMSGPDCSLLPKEWRQLHVLRKQTELAECLPHSSFTPKSISVFRVTMRVIVMMLGTTDLSLMCSIIVSSPSLASALCISVSLTHSLSLSLSKGPANSGLGALQTVGGTVYLHGRLSCQGYHP